MLADAGMATQASAYALAVKRTLSALGLDSPPSGGTGGNNGSTGSAVGAPPTRRGAPSGGTPGVKPDLLDEFRKVITAPFLRRLDGLLERLSGHLGPQYWADQVTAASPTTADSDSGSSSSSNFFGALISKIGAPDLKGLVDGLGPGEQAASAANSTSTSSMQGPNNNQAPTALPANPNASYSGMGLRSTYTFAVRRHAVFAPTPAPNQSINMQGNMQGMEMQGQVQGALAGVPSVPPASFSPHNQQQQQINQNPNQPLSSGEHYQQQ